MNDLEREAMLVTMKRNLKLEAENAELKARWEKLEEKPWLWCKKKRYDDGCYFCPHIQKCLDKKYENGGLSSGGEVPNNSLEKKNKAISSESKNSLEITELKARLEKAEKLLLEIHNCDGCGCRCDSHIDGWCEIIGDIMEKELSSGNESPNDKKELSSKNDVWNKDICQRETPKPVCPRCWSANKINKDCPDCHGTGIDPKGRGMK